MAPDSAVTLLLVRHAQHCDYGRRLTGRAGGVRLTEEGRRQAEAVGRRLASLGLSEVQTSPRERAVETAEAIARATGTKLRVTDALDEIDFGDWTGRTVESLHDDSLWRDFNSLRATTVIPRGDWLPEVQARAIAGLLRLPDRHDDGHTVVIVSHADVIRAALTGLLGMPLDLMLRLNIDPASISVVELHGTWPRVLSINSRLLE